MKGRQKLNPPKGSKHYGAKFTEQEVLDIRSLLAGGEQQKVVAKMYGVSHLTIHAIKHRKTWKHI